MWRPDFEPVENRPARLSGWHRAMCILSTVYRGCPDQPGLVLGLDRGGSCLGRALRVAPDQWDDVRQRLDRRELVNGVYHPRFLPVRLDDGRRVSAYVFVVNRDNPQYWSGTPQQAAELIRQGKGLGGCARDYLANTVDHLRAMGVREGILHRLLDLVDQA